jgi:hypothetical protein
MYLLYITVKSLKAFPGKARSSSRGVHGIFKPEVSTLEKDELEVGRIGKGKEGGSGFCVLKVRSS